MGLCKFLDENGVKCGKQPYFNYEGKPAEFCAKHKEENMVDVKHKKCIHEGCKKLPVFNFEGRSTGVYCFTHKENGMIDIKNKKCIHEGCKKQPVFNFEGQSKGIYCFTHKENGMIDIKHKKCIHIDENGNKCEKRPSFNFEGRSFGVYCFTHKENGMVNVRDKKCIHEGCKKLPVFNFEGRSTGVYCFAHKENGMIDIKSKRCIHCLTQQINKHNPIYKNENSCAYCFYNLYPDHPLSRNYKTKELMVVEFIKDNFPDFEFTFDQKIQGGCSRRRPDIYLELETHCIIIEVDENQHIDYDTLCEERRINDLYSDIGLPIVFIRFNPDEYKIGDKNITSCFGTTKSNNNIHVRQSKKTEWYERLEKLKNTIIDNIKFPEFNNQLCKFIYLFYDQ